LPNLRLRGGAATGEGGAIWLYLTALAILFGGEVAVSLEQGLHSGAIKKPWRR
jgi:uncharacterized BrkB/YihY/UPF0761 family membrane protein